MIRRRLAIACLFLVPAAAACVDLFHSTDFETKCTKSPPDPSCGADVDGATDAATTDAETGAPPHPDFCTYSAGEAQKQAERACAWLGACEGPIDSSRFGPCVAAARLIYDCQAGKGRRPAGDVDKLWGCLTQVKTCGDVDACIFPGSTVPPCPAVAAGAKFTACSGSVRVECASTTAGRPTSVEPCLAGAQTCTVINGSFSQCTGVKGKTCTTSSCTGASAVACGSGSSANIDIGHDCAGIGGGSCVLVDGGPACAPSGGALTCKTGTTTNPRCDVVSSVSRISSACVSTFDISIDCEAINARCDVTALSLFSPERACITPGTGQTCTGDDECALGKLVSCAAGGVRHELDCTSVGLGACAVRPDGYAHCTAP